MILGTVGSLLIVSFVSHGIASLEFESAVGTRNRSLEYLPLIVGYFHRVHNLWWVLPVVASIFGLLLLARAECRTLFLAWFLSVVALAIVGWASFFVLALYLVRTNFYMCR